MQLEGEWRSSQQTGDHDLPPDLLCLPRGARVPGLSIVSSPSGRRALVPPLPRVRVASTRLKCFPPPTPTPSSLPLPLPPSLSPLVHFACTLLPSCPKAYPRDTRCKWPGLRAQLPLSYRERRSSIIFLLHIALEAPLAIMGLLSPLSLPFIQLTNTTLVLLKVRTHYIQAAGLLNNHGCGVDVFGVGRRLVYRGAARLRAPRYATVYSAL